MDSSKADRLFQDYSTEEVPPEKTRTWLSMGLVWSGVGISLGLLLTGGTVAQGLTIKQAAVAGVLGGIILAVISTLTGIVGARAHLSTAMVSRFAFGNRAVLLIAMLQALGAYGWFAVQLGLFSRAASTAWESTTGLQWSDGPFIVIGGLLMIATSIVGYRALDKLSKVAVPLMLLLMAASVWRIFSDSSVTEILTLRGGGPAITLGTGISLVVSSFVVGAVIAPDVSRYAKSPKHVVGGAVLAFAVVTPTVMAVGSLMALETGTSDIVNILLRLGWGALALVLLMLAQWTSNDNNLYSAALGFVVVLRKWKKWQLTGIAGVIGIVLALAGIYDSFTTFLTVLGVFVPPMAGVIVIDYYVTRKTVYRGGFETNVVPVRVLSLVAWAVGSAASALTSYTALSLTSIPAVDGLLVAAILQVFFGRFLEKGSAVQEPRPEKGYEYAG
ncbi:MAG: cytosine permease [Streptosporangiales bacterium]|nr:cytosine permease [Streptosporangiales bacterium]